MIEATKRGPSAWETGSRLKLPRFRPRRIAFRERTNVPIATLHRLVDDNAKTLGAAAQRNATHWRSLPYPDRLTFEKDVSQMKEWIAARVSWLDAEIWRRAK